MFNHCFHLISVINEFVERKLSLQFQEKLKIDLVHNYEIRVREKDLFYKDHIKYSSTILFKKYNPCDSNYEKEEKSLELL